MLESLFNEITGLQACNFIKKRLQHRCFPMKFAKFSRTLILKNMCERLLLYFLISIPVLSNIFLYHRLYIIWFFEAYCLLGNVDRQLKSCYINHYIILYIFNKRLYNIMLMWSESWGFRGSDHTTIVYMYVVKHAIWGNKERRRREQRSNTRWYLLIKLFQVFCKKWLLKI